MSAVSANSGWVVPPQRRLISSAYERHSTSLTSAKSTASAADDALAREPAPDLQRLGGDERRVLLVGGEVTAEVRLPVRTAEDLVVRGHDVDLTRRAHPELHARAAEIHAFDPLLDDASLVVERTQVLVDVDLRVLEIASRLADPRPTRPRSSSALPRPLTPWSSLSTAPRAPGLRFAQLPAEPRRDRARRRPRARPGAGHPPVLEDPTATRLRPQPVELGIAAVDRKAERDGEPRLVLGHAERQDERQLGIADQAADPRSAPGRASSFRDSGSLRPSTSETGDEARRASGVSSSGTSPK